MTFRPGESGNPGGRPRAVGALRSLAQMAGLDAFRRVVELTKHEDPKVALEAVKIVLDRGFGRPTQPVDGDGQGGPIAHKVEIVIVDPQGDVS